MAIKTASSTLAMIVLLLALLLAPAQPARAAVLSVDNSGACSDATGVPAYCTIQAAINAAAPGDTVNVAGGPYPVTFLNIAKPLILQGDPAGSRPKIEFGDGDYDGLNIAADDVTVQNLWLYRAGRTYYRGIVGVPKGGTYPNYTIDHARIAIRDCSIQGGRYGLYVQAEDLTVENCTFDNTYRDSIILAAVQGTTTIRDNHFVGTTYSGKKAILVEGGTEQPYVSGTIDVAYNTCVGKYNFFVFGHWGNPAAKVDLLIQHNSIDQVPSKVVSFYAAYTGDPTAFAKFDSIVIRDNIVSNSGLAVYVDYEDYGGAPPADSRAVPANGQIVVQNTLTYNNSAGATDQTDPTGNFGYSNVAGMTPAGASMAMFALSSNVEADPLWVDTAHANHNFSLQPGSPGLGAATDGTNIGAWQGSYTPESHVSQITGQFILTRSGIQLKAYAWVVNDGGAPLPGATVTANLTVPGKGTTPRTAVTDSTGRAYFTDTARVRGTWQLCVTGVTLAGYDFQTGANDCMTWLY